MSNIPKYELTDMRPENQGDVQVCQKFCRLKIRSEPRSFANITSCVEQWIKKIGAKDGLLTLFLRHTSASLTIQENTDQDVQKDILDALEIVAPRHTNWRHSLEGPDDMPSHIKSVLVGFSHSIPVLNGAIELGTWQDIYLIEHRDQSHQRTLSLHFIGELV